MSLNVTTVQVSLCLEFWLWLFQFINIFNLMLMCVCKKKQYFTQELDYGQFSYAHLISMYATLL